MQVDGARRKSWIVPQQGPFHQLQRAAGGKRRRGNPPGTETNERPASREARQNRQDSRGGHHHRQTGGAELRKEDSVTGGFPGDLMGHHQPGHSHGGARLVPRNRRPEIHAIAPTAAG
jgi:hypothetical protein